MLDITLPDGLRQAEQQDWRLIGDILAEAFCNDPVASWILGTPKAMPSVFSRFAKGVYLPHGICHLANDEAATMWLLSGAEKEPPFSDFMLMALDMIRYGGFGALQRGTAAGKEMARHTPKEPHLYLYMIGVRESGRGKGLGRKLMAPVLEACDRAGLPAYLENSNPRNHGFYAAQGFERLEIFEPGPGAPPLEAMWRVPQ